MAKVVAPRVQAMVLCDFAEESENETGVYHLMGVRSTIESSFPAVVSQLSVFAQLSGHPGEALCHIEIEHAESTRIIFETAPESIIFDGPTSIVTVVIPLADCVFPAPGLYYLQMCQEGKLIGERPLHLQRED